MGGLEVREATIGEKGFVEDEEGTEKAETSDERRQNSRLRARGKRLRVQRGAPEEPGRRDLESQHERECRACPGPWERIDRDGVDEQIKISRAETPAFRKQTECAQGIRSVRTEDDREPERPEEEEPAGKDARGCELYGTPPSLQEDRKWPEGLAIQLRPTVPVISAETRCPPQNATTDRLERAVGQQRKRLLDGDHQANADVTLWALR